MKSILITSLADQSDVTLVDVRDQNEYAAGHVPGGINIPLGQLRSRISEIPSTDTVHVICESGRRSAQATEALAALGINAVNVEGGTAAWTQAGLPLDTF